MAILKNMLFNELSGRIGDIVFKQYKQGVVISKVADMSNVKATAKQKKARKEFAAAVAYARKINGDPALRKAFESKIGKDARVYQSAIKAYYKSKKE